MDIFKRGMLISGKDTAKLMETIWDIDIQI